MNETPGLQIECTTATIGGQTQRWFRVVARPAGMSFDQAERLMIDALSRNIVGPWMWSLVIPKS